MNWRGGAQLGLGMAHLLGEGGLAAASRWLSSAVAINLEVGNHFAALYANYFLGQAQLAQGRLKAAEATYLEALELVSGSPDIPAGLASWAQLGLGEIWRERNRFREASERLLEAIRLGKAHDNKETVVKALIGLAKIEAAQGRWTEVEQLLEEAAISARKPGIPDLSGALEQARDWATMRRGDPMAAQSRQPELEDALERGLHSWRIPPAILRARQLNAREQFAEAEQLARRLLAVLAPDQRASRLEVEIIQALALRGLGQNAEALHALRPALAFGANSGYRRMFLDEGEPMLIMLGGVEGEDRVARFARELLAEADGGQDAPVPIGHALIEPLSNTELEMLALLSQGMTNLQIAEHRVVSINTVKWHLKNIYGKLGVSNRTAAVSKARSLGLL